MDYREELEQLIPKYALNKGELDSYKKLCDADGNRIKQLMTENDEDEFTAAGYTAKKIIQHRETMVEERLLKLFHSVEGIEHLGLIKTKEVVDFDALEAALYNAELPTEVLEQLDSCRETKEVVTLKVTTKRKK